MSTPIVLPQEEPVDRGVRAPGSGRKLRRRIVGLLVGLASVLVLGLVSPSPAGAAGPIERNLGMRCVGDDVPRCVWVNFDRQYGRFRAYARVQDSPDIHQYWVKVNDIQLVYRDPWLGFVRVGNPGADNDGWHDVIDSGQSGLVGCDTVRRLPGRAVYAQARFSWTGYKSGSQTLVSFPVKRC
jgi:hypothetical protein